MVDHSNMKTGKKAPRHDKRTLALANYLDFDALPAAPASVNWAAKVTNLGMMQNDSIGDCTLAGAGHAIQTDTANNGSQVIVSDADIVTAYSAVTGYNPADPSTDQGAVETDVLNYWRKTGVGGHKIFAYTALEPKNKDHIKLAVNLFGGVYIGLALPISAQSQDVWHVAPGGSSGSAAPGSWGGHCVEIIGYGPGGLKCITWGAVKAMTWGFWYDYCDEAYATLSQDWAVGTKQAPSGFTFAQLQTDLNQVIG